MRKRLLMLFFAILTFSLVHSQEMKQVSAIEQRAMVDKINATVTAMKTMQCKFSQIKKMSLMQEDVASSGQLFYTQEGKLRWEYLKPFTYQFILNGDNVIIKSSSKTNIIDIKTSKVFREITKIIMSSITGKCLSESGDFDVTLLSNGKTWVAQMFPKKKEMKRMFQSVKLYFDSKESIVKKIEMLEKNGDVTTINMYDVLINNKIDASVFSVD